MYSLDTMLLILLKFLLLGVHTDGIIITVDEQRQVCHGGVPHSTLEPDCIYYPPSVYPPFALCYFTCDEGYRPSEIQDIIVGYRNYRHDRRQYVICMDGLWITHLHGNSIGFNDVCLPEADFYKCPLTIPNGVMERRCGPATDWLCHFECNRGYVKHIYMSGKLKRYPDGEYSLLCVNGTWKTGYEDLGMDSSNVCVQKDTMLCEEDLPNLRIRSISPCLSGRQCAFECNTGFHRYPTSSEFLFCADGVWYQQETKNNPDITPQTVCVPNESEIECPEAIPHGHVQCTPYCVVICDEGYYWLSEWSRYPVTCEGGQWLTGEYAYTGDNICFPNGGFFCPGEIPHGTAIGSDGEHGRPREYVNPTCAAGFRKYRSVDLECVAGKWMTGQERFGLGASTICVPETSENAWSIPDYFQFERLND